MPWRVVKEPGGNSYAVINEDTHKVKGSGMTKERAEAMLRALYANVQEASQSRGHMNVPWTYKGGE